MNKNLFRTKPISHILQTSGQRGLKRQLGVIDLTALGLGAIVGTGIFVITGVAAARYAGPAVTLSLVIAGVVAGLSALVYAELASMVPVAGSAYTYSYAALGELAAWIIGWDLVLEYTVAASAVAIGWGAYITDLLAAAGVVLPPLITNPPADGGIINLPAVTVVLAITVLLVRGAKETAAFTTVIVAVKLVVIVVFVVAGAPRIDPINWVPFFPFGLRGVVRGAAIVFFAYIGFDAVSTAAEEVRHPRTDLPLAILLSLGIATVLYLSSALVLTGLAPYQTLNTASPMTRALINAGIRWGTGFVSLGAIFGLTSVLLVDIYGQTRVFYAMARDGLMPPWFGRLHPKFGTPTAVTTFTGITVALIGGFLPVATVAELANIGTLGAFVLVSVGILVLRKTRPELPRPFRVPGMPWTPLLAIAASLYLMANLPLLTWVRFGVWLAIGLVIYFVYSRHHSILNKPPGS